jgi:hypothetical protein
LAAATSGWVAIGSTTIAAAVGSWGRWATISTAIRGSRGSAESTAVAWTATTSELSEVTVGTSATATATGASASTAAAKSGTLTGNVLEECGNFLVGFLQKLNEVPDNSSVATVEECSRDTSVTGTTCTTDSVHVVIDIRWKIVVDNVLNVRDIQTSCRDSGGDEDWATSISEHLKSTLTLTLGAVTVDGGCREVLVDQEV